MRTLLLLVLLLGSAACAQTATPAEPQSAGRVRFTVTDFATGLSHPWGGAFLPDGRLLVTERDGRMRLIDQQGQVSAPLAGVPAVEAHGQGGLLDVALAPDFATTREIYFCQAALRPDGALTRLSRAVLAPDASGLRDVRTLLDATPAQRDGRNHYGCRIAFDREGALYLSTGERQQDRQRAQRLDDLGGKVLRLARDGRPFPGNPFANRPGARPEVFSYGHRNPQGLALNPRTGRIWAAEFGARGGDEINVILPGRNYGWPVVTRGIDYDGSRIGEGQSRPDMQDPVRFWGPRDYISPSGIAFYNGAAFPAWRGSLFVAALNFPGLVRLTTDGDRVTAEERLLWNRMRLRQVLVGPDDRIYLLTDEGRDRVLRLDPAPP